MLNKEQNKRTKNKRIQQLTQNLIKDPFNPYQSQIYAQRSQQYSLQGDYVSAITDLSKSLYLQPNYEGYVKRGRLYASTEMFYCALMDFQEASRLYHQQKKQQNKRKREQIKKQQEKEDEAEAEIVTLQNINIQTQSFLQNSTVILKLPQLKKITKQHQTIKPHLPLQMNSQFNKIMTKIIQQKVNAQVNLIKKQNEDYQRLLQIVKRQQQRIKQLQSNISKKLVDYEYIFYKQMEDSTMSDINKQKCTIYFCTIMSQMQKYYLSAKVLSEFDEKISFQDYNIKLKQKPQANKKVSKSIIEKIFKLFQKHQSKLQRLGQMLKQVPYVGSVFKMIKSSMKVCGWLQQVKGQSQCQNILSVRPTVTSFNKLSGKVAYEMYKYFKINITQAKPENQSEIYRKSCLDKLNKMLRKFRRNQIATRVFSHIKIEQKNYVEQIGRVHASILMAGIAYGVFKLPNDILMEILSQQTELFDNIARIQKQLLATQAEQDILESWIQQEPNHQAKQQESACKIF